MTKPKKAPKPKPAEPELGTFQPRTPTQAKAMAALREYSLIFLIGPAGTGKTLIAAHYAAERLANKTARQIILSRPPVEAGQSIGALPGNQDEKMDPYIRPLFKSLGFFIPKDKFGELRHKKVIEIVSPTFLRGETYHDAVCIYDEMQNATPEQLKTALTRAGENTTMIVTADPGQIDLPNPDMSAIHDIGMFVGHKGIAVIEFDTVDVIRSEIVKTIIGIYAGDKPTRR